VCSSDLLPSKFPNHSWIPWKFKHLTEAWLRKVQRHVLYLDWLLTHLRHEIPQHLYSISILDISSNYGTSLLKHHYGNSLEKFVTGLNPEFDWIEWMFKGTRKWEDLENHKRYFDWLGEELSFTKPSHWQALSYADMIRLNGLSLVEKYYNGCVNEFIFSHLDNYRAWDREERKRVMQKWMHDLINELLPFLPTQKRSMLSLTLEFQ